MNRSIQEEDYFVDLVTKLLDSAWFVGITGGTISGLIVFFITNKFFNSRKEVEYQKNVSSANQEIIQAVKMFFIQKQPIGKEIVVSMIAATARKFSLKDGDLFSLNNIADFIIKEIMETSFLSVEDKKDLCLLIYSELRSEIVINKENTVTSSIYSRSEVKFMSTIMALMTVFFTLATTLSIGKQSIISDNILAAPSLIGVIGAFISVVVSILIGRLEKEKSVLTISKSIDQLLNINKDKEQR